MTTCTHCCIYRALTTRPILSYHSKRTLSSHWPTTVLCEAETTAISISHVNKAGLREPVTCREPGVLSPQKRRLRCIVHLLSLRYLRGHQADEGDLFRMNPQGSTKARGDSGSGYEVDKLWVKSLNQFPVLYSRTLLFTHSIYNSLHLLIPNSQSIPPSRPQDRKHSLLVDINLQGDPGHITALCVSQPVEHLQRLGFMTLNGDRTPFRDRQAQ